MENRHLCKARPIGTRKQWVTGFYAVLGEKTVIIVNEPEKFYDVDSGKNSHGNKIVEVIPKTVCQCTGLKDDDGTLIFENDVLSLKDEISKCEWKAVVKFGNSNSEYTWGWQLVPITECDANKDILMWVETEMGYMYCEVIGNIFDNPELLEVQP